MSAQYSDNPNKPYCDTCQAASQHITFDFSNCYSQNQFISKDAYNKIINSLKTIQNFGEKELSETRKPIDANSLQEKQEFDLINIIDYNNIIYSIEQNINLKEQYDIIFGAYYEDLINAIKNYKLQTTRVYNCKGQIVTECCAHTPCGCEHSGPYSCRPCFTGLSCGSEEGSCNPQGLG